MTTITRRLGDASVTTNSGHRLHAYASEAGYTASCTCGWRQVRTDRNQRDRDTAEHVTPTSRQTP